MQLLQETEIGESLLAPLHGSHSQVIWMVELLSLRMALQFNHLMKKECHAALMLALVIASVAAPLIAQHSPIEQSMDMLAPPSGAHWLGTDDLGRDVFARMVYGAPMSLYASMVAVGVGLALGLPTGMLAGYLGGRVDTVISRIIDTLLAFPGIILAVAVTGALGIGLTNAMIAVGIVFAPNIARLIRIESDHH